MVDDETKIGDTRRRIRHEPNRVTAQVEPSIPAREGRGGLHLSSSYTAGGVASGRMRENVEPRPGALVTSIQPPCCTAMR